MKMDITIQKIKELIDIYGAHATLEKVLKKRQGNKIYECPKCNGRGVITIEYNIYPDNLPDSGWVYEPGYKDIECNLCDGEGYTEQQL